MRCQTRPRPVLGGGSAGDTGRHITRPAGTSECALVCARVCEWMCGRPHREPRTLKYLVRYYLWSRIPFGFKKASLEIEKKKTGLQMPTQRNRRLGTQTAGCICQGVPGQTRVGKGRGQRLVRPPVYRGSVEAGAAAAMLRWARLCWWLSGDLRARPIGSATRPWVCLKRSFTSGLVRQTAGRRPRPTCTCTVRVKRTHSHTHQTSPTPGAGPRCPPHGRRHRQPANPPTERRPQGPAVLCPTVERY